MIGRWLGLAVLRLRCSVLNFDWGLVVGEGVGRLMSRVGLHLRDVLLVVVWLEFVSLELCCICVVF